MVNCSYILNLFDDSKSIRIENKLTHQTKYVISDKSVEELILRYHPGYELIGKVLGFKYTTGDFLGWHKDNTYRKEANLTGGVVLNDKFTGGKFELKNGTYIDQTPGEVFTLGRNILHRVTKIKSGTRYSLHYSLLSKSELI